MDERGYDEGLEYEASGDYQEQQEEYNLLATPTVLVGQVTRRLLAFVKVLGLL